MQILLRESSVSLQINEKCLKPLEAITLKPFYSLFKELDDETIIAIIHNQPM